MNTLTIEGFLKEGISIGLKNAPALIVNVILWLVTIWIPYLNVGTTIALTNLAAKMSKDQGLEMTEVFKPEYRKFMGEYFLVLMFTLMGFYTGFLFFVIPGYVLWIAWSLAPLLVLDKGMEPMAAIKKSNELTYGSKWVIFGGNLVVMIVFWIALFILSFLGGLIHQNFGVFLVIIGMLLFYPVMAGTSAYVYKTLTAGRV
jgi:uncharacterized membrane protein